MVAGTGIPVIISILAVVGTIFCSFMSKVGIGNPELISTNQALIGLFKLFISSVGLVIGITAMFIAITKVKKLKTSKPMVNKLRLELPECVTRYDKYLNSSVCYKGFNLASCLPESEDKLAELIELIKMYENIIDTFEDSILPLDDFSDIKVKNNKIYVSFNGAYKESAELIRAYLGLFVNRPELCNELEEEFSNIDITPYVGYNEYMLEYISDFIHFKPTYLQVKGMTYAVIRDDINFDDGTKIKTKVVIDCSNYTIVRDKEIKDSVLAKYNLIDRVV